MNRIYWGWRVYTLSSKLDKKRVEVERWEEVGVTNRKWDWKFGGLRGFAKQM